MSGDQVRACVQVALPPARAFDLFTGDIDRWWRRGPKFRHAGLRRGIILIEPQVGGRLYESFEGSAGETQVIELGAVTVWLPPERLVFRWRNANFAAGEWTEVEVTFEPAAGGTRVTVTHRGWLSIRPDHPARHGLQRAAFIRMLALWWGEQLTALRLVANPQQEG